MRKISSNDIFVSAVGEGQEQEFLAYDFQNHVEIAYFSQPHILDGEWQKDAERFLKILQPKGSFCSLHGPFGEMNYQSKDRLIQDAVQKRFQQILEVGNFMQAKFIVLHSTYNRLSAQPQNEEKWVQAAAGFFSPIVERAEKSGITLLLENIYDDRPEPIKRLLQKINSPHFKACIDIGHWFLFSKQPISHWIDVYGKDLGYFHLHDNQGTYDDHGAIGSGKIPFQNLFEALENSPAQPKYCIEVQLVKSIDASLAYLKEKNYLEGATLIS